LADEYNSAEECFKLRQEANEVSDWVKDFKVRYAGDYSVGETSEYVIVGHDLKPTNEHCGKFVGFYGCDRVALHNKTMFEPDGKLVDYAGKVAVHPAFHHCDKSSCPVCFLWGWALREAKNIEGRIREASKLYGIPYHVVVSPSKADYGLSLKQMKAKVLRGLRRRGVHGGVELFHAFRYANYKESVRKHVPFGWYLGMHFHLLGFIDDRFDKCRRCRFRNARGSRYVCKNCCGFYGVAKKEWLKDGLIVEVLEDRKSVFKTAFYQLNHASMRKGKNVRSSVVTWFGTCSYRRLKYVPEKHVAKCPICGKEAFRIRYFGGKIICLNRESFEFKSWLFMDEYEDGKQVFCERGEDGFG
jgi:hypothetical protein